MSKIMKIGSAAVLALLLGAAQAQAGPIWNIDISGMAVGPTSFCRVACNPDSGGIHWRVMGSSIDTSIDSIASVQGNARNISLFGFGFPRGFVNGGFSDSHVFLVGDDFSFNLYFTEIDGVITDFTPLFPGICLLNGGPGCFTITSASGTVIDPEVQTASLAAVPEPGSLLLLLAGFIGLGMTKQKTPALPGLSLRGGKSEGSC